MFSQPYRGKCAAESWNTKDSLPSVKALLRPVVLLYLSGVEKPALPRQRQGLEARKDHSVSEKRGTWDTGHEASVCAEQSVTEYEGFL